MKCCICDLDLTGQPAMVDKATGDAFCSRDSQYFGLHPSNRPRRATTDKPRSPDLPFASRMARNLRNAWAEKRLQMVLSALFFGLFLGGSFLWLDWARAKNSPLWIAGTLALTLLGGVVFAVVTEMFAPINPVQPQQEQPSKEAARGQTNPRLLTRVFTPVIPPEVIAEALETPEDFQLSEGVRSEQKSEHRQYLLKILGYSFAGLAFGVILQIGSAFLPTGVEVVFRLGGLLVMAASPVFFVVGLLLHLIPPSQSKPEKCFYEFLSNLLTSIPDCEKSYRVLAPTTKSRLSIYVLKGRWEDLLATLKSLVATQDKASCAICGKEGAGLWSFSTNSWLTGEYVLSNEYLRRSQDFMRCKGCEFVYCANCYLQLANKGQCRGCGKTLHGVALKILMVGSQIQFNLQVQEVKSCTRVLAQKEERVANLCCEEIFASECQPPWETGYKFVKMGDKGTVVCRFHNTALRIGNKWYVLSGDPGDMLEA